MDSYSLVSVLIILNPTPTIPGGGYHSPSTPALCAASTYATAKNYVLAVLDQLPTTTSTTNSASARHHPLLNPRKKLGVPKARRYCLNGTSTYHYSGSWFHLVKKIPPRLVPSIRAQLRRR